MIGRQSLPVFGSHSPFLQKGQWELGVSYRGFVSDKHYQGSEPFPELDPFGPRNRQHQLSIRVATAVTELTTKVGVTFRF